LKIRNGRLISFSTLPTHPAIINILQPPFTMIRIKAECKVLSIYADIMQEIDTTVKEYYTDGRDNIDQKA